MTAETVTSKCTPLTTLSPSTNTITIMINMTNHCAPMLGGGRADYWGLGDKGAGGGGGGGGAKEVRWLGSLEAGEIVKGLNDFPAVNRSGRKSTVRRPSLAVDFLLLPLFLSFIYLFSSFAHISSNTAGLYDVDVILPSVHTKTAGTGHFLQALGCPL